jgi:hypothetical protein
MHVLFHVVHMIAQLPLVYYKFMYKRIINNDRFHIIIMKLSTINIFYIKLWVLC